jgi:hypothetical protein
VDHVKLPIVTTTLLAASCWLSCSYHSNLRQLVDGSPAERYMGEFLAAEAEYPGGERDGSRASVGNAELFHQAEPGIPIIGGGCHSVWLRTPTSQERVLVVREADPGSESSFGFAWSKDGQAAFIFGGHSGLDCARDGGYGKLRIIYTLVDGVAWMVPETRGRPTKG